jgi:hypothetical protein
LRIIGCYGQDFCARAHDSSNKACVCSDARLGSVVLPSCLPFVALIDSSTICARYGGLFPGGFLSTCSYYAPPGRLRYPICSFADGFSKNTDDVPVRGRLTLKRGVKASRFSGMTGSFVGSAGTRTLNEHFHQSVSILATPCKFHVSTTCTKCRSRLWWLVGQWHPGLDNLGIASDSSHRRVSRDW